MKKLLIALAVFHLSVFTFAKDGKQAYIPNLQQNADYVNSFDTVGEYLTELTQWGLINSDEKAAVVALLEKNNIALSEKLEKAKVKGTKVSWGNVTLELSKDNLKVNSGLVVRTGSGRKFDEVFAEIFNSEKSKKTAIFSVLIPDAQAQGPGQQSFLSRAVYGAGYHTMKTLSTIIQGVVAGGANVIGPFFVAWRHLQTGNVTCDEFGGYEINIGFKKSDWDAAYQTALTNRRLNSRGTPDRETMLDGYSAEVHAAYRAGVAMINEEIDFNRLGESIVSTEVLRRTFGTPIPACTPQRARSVQNELRRGSSSRGEAIARRIQEARADRARNPRAE